MTQDIFSHEYAGVLQQIKGHIQQAQVQAVLSINRELILLYWQIGKHILEQQEQQGWGAKVIERLSKDLHAAFPQMKGFSSRNLKYMRAFAEAYPNKAIVQKVSAQITWSHNTTLLDKVKDPDERLWYVQQSAEHGWSHALLETQIETQLYHRQGKAITNFKRTLPALDSELAAETLKDPYIFDFITTSNENKERHIQNALLTHIQRFLLELGTGFTFVGSNYHLIIGNQDFYLDLLFYHIRLRCFIVIDLKTGRFIPEYAGKMNFYLSAVDAQVKHSDDNATIGLVLCKEKGEKIVAEYALKDIHKPVGVATYRTTSMLPENLKDQLPDIKELEERLQEVQGENIP